MSQWSDIAYTDDIRSAQQTYGTRECNKKLESRDRDMSIDDNLAAFIATRDSIYLATASADGRPYIQHRGGEPGFIKVLDNRTLGFAEYPGNKQLITTGNLFENDQAFIFMMDYPNRQRIKLWGRAEIVDNPAFIARVLDGGSAIDRKIARAIRFRVEAWDANCPKHITERYTSDVFAKATEVMRNRIAELEAEIAKLKRETPD